MDYHPLNPAIRDILTAIRHRQSLEDVVALILDRSCQLADAVHGSFVKVDHDTSELLITCVHGPDWTPEKRGFVLKVGKGITGKVAETGIPYLCSDTARDPDYYPLFDFVRSELVVPVIVNDKIWGIINLDGMRPNAFDAETLATMRVFGELCAFAISIRWEMIEHERWQAHVLKNEKLAALGEVIAGIAHEINNPLTSILGHATLLSLRHKLEEDSSLQGILDETRRAADLVRSLLHFSRQDELEKLNIDVNEIVEAVVSLKQYQFRVHNISLELDLSRSPCPVLASPPQLQQVLLNLINNAIQAIPDERRDGFITVSTERQGERVEISVIDNGTGISDEAQKQLFDPFFTTREVGQGRGLGLTIAHSIAEQHGGGLRFNARPEGGTRFVMELPLAHGESDYELWKQAEKQTQSIPQIDMNEEPPAQSRVLVVDDEPLILETLEAFLRHSGMEPILARDGEEAIGHVRDSQFDAVLSDIRMPNMDGLQFFDAAVAHDKRYRERFVFMSGDLVRESTREFVSESGCPCLEKPFNMQQVLDLLQTKIIGQEV